MDGTQRTGLRRGAAVFISCLMLICLLLQFLPFTFCQPPAAAGAAGDGTVPCIQPLQVCGDGQGPGGFIADIPWIAASPRTPSLPLRAQSLAAVSFPGLPEGASSPIYRPPRPSFSLT